MYYDKLDKVMMIANSLVLLCGAGMILWGVLILTDFSITYSSAWQLWLGLSIVLLATIAEFARQWRRVRVKERLVSRRDMVWLLIVGSIGVWVASPLITSDAPWHAPFAVVGVFIVLLFVLNIVSDRLNRQYQKHQWHPIKEPDK